MVLRVLLVVLALSNLGTAWGAAAVLAKDTSVSNGMLVDKNTYQALATTDMVETFVFKAPEPQASRRRNLAQTIEYDAGITFGEAKKIYNDHQTMNVVLQKI
jgi:hypothetical protein